LSTEERIARIFRETLSVEVPSPTTDIIEAGLLDSLALVTLLFELESEFGVAITLEHLDVEQLRTIERIAALVDSRVGEGERGLRP